MFVDFLYFFTIFINRPSFNEEEFSKILLLGF